VILTNWNKIVRILRVRKSAHGRPSRNPLPS